MITISSKATDEVIVVSFDYAALLGDGETVSSASVGIAVRTGVDPDVAAMLAGSTSVGASVVSHLVRNGVDAADYTLTCLATTSAGQVLRLSGILPVRDA